MAEIIGFIARGYVAVVKMTRSIMYLLSWRAEYTIKISRYLNSTGPEFTLKRAQRYRYERESSGRQVSFSSSCLWLRNEKTKPETKRKFVFLLEDSRSILYAERQM